LSTTKQKQLYEYMAICNSHMVTSFEKVFKSSMSKSPSD